MSPEFFFPSIPIVGGLSFVALIVLGVAAMQDGKHGTKADVVKRVYIYLVSFITLLLIGAAVISLVNLGLRAGVFVRADPVGNYQSPPPSPYLSPELGKEPVATPPTITCSEKCSLTDQLREEIKNWEQNYRDWQITSKESYQRSQALITPFSFLIVAGIVFLFHWRFVRRDGQIVEEGKNLTRSSYFSAMSFIWLITTVVSAGFLLNSGLKIAFGADTPSGFGPRPVSFPYEGPIVESILNCAEKCELSDETVALAKQWEADYQKWQERESDKSRQRHNDLSNELGFVIVSLPLFWYHFRTAWRERKPPTVVE